MTKGRWIVGSEPGNDKGTVILAKGLAQLPEGPGIDHVQTERHFLESQVILDVVVCPVKPDKDNRGMA